MNIKWNYSSAPGGEHLIGLEYILNLFNLQHIELAEKLGIKKQNIKYQMVGMNNLKIEDVSYNVVRFLSHINIDDIKILSFMRNKKLDILLE